MGAAFGAKKLYVGDRPLTVGVWYVPSSSIYIARVVDGARATGRLTSCVDDIVRSPYHHHHHHHHHTAMKRDTAGAGALSPVPSLSLPHTPCFCSRPMSSWWRWWRGGACGVGCWHSAERFEAMSRLYYRAARAACVCYDLTRAETWPKVKFWINELLSFEKECALYVLPAAFSAPPLLRSSSSKSTTQDIVL